MSESEEIALSRLAREIAERSWIEAAMWFLDQAGIDARTQDRVLAIVERSRGEYDACEE